jgi:WD40 repeat protein
VSRAVNKWNVRPKNLLQLSVVLMVVVAIIYVIAGLPHKWFMSGEIGYPRIPFAADSLCFDRSGKFLIMVHDGLIDIRSLHDNAQVALIEMKGNEITALACDSDRSVAYCGTVKGYVKQLDLDTFVLSGGVSLSPTKIVALAVSLKNQVIIASYSDGTVRMAELRDGRIIYQKQFRWKPRCLAVSQDEKLVAFAGGDNGEFHVVTIGSMQEHVGHVTCYVPHTYVESFAFCGQTHVLAMGVGQELSGIRLWDCDLNKETGMLEIGNGGIWTMTCTEDGERLVAGDLHGSLFICQVNPMRVVKQVPAHNMAAVAVLALSGDGKILASSCDDIGIDDQRGHGEVRFWSLDKIIPNGKK